MITVKKLGTSKRLKMTATKLIRLAAQFENACYREGVDDLLNELNDVTQRIGQEKWLLKNRRSEFKRVEDDMPF